MVPISYFIFHVVCVFKSLNPVRDHLFNIDLRVHLSCIYSIKIISDNNLSQLSTPDRYISRQKHRPPGHIGLIRVRPISP